MDILFLIYTILTFIHNTIVVTAILTDENDQDILHTKFFTFSTVYSCVAALYLIYSKKMEIDPQYKHIVVGLLITLLLSSLNIDIGTILKKGKGRIHSRFERMIN